MSASETDLRRGLAVLDQYREQLEALAQQQEIVRASLEEHMRARETLLRYQQAGKGAEVLVPVGANAFVVASSLETEKAFVGIGSDLVLYQRSARSSRSPPAPTPSRGVHLPLPEFARPVRQRGRRTADQVHAQKTLPNRTTMRRKSPIRIPSPPIR